jgi:uncharacterized protein (TIGR02270 family)
MHAMTSAAPLPHVVAQHVEEAAHLSHVRSVLLLAPHVRLEALCRLDHRLAAHLDGVAVAGELGWQLCEAALEAAAPGAVFCGGVRAIEDGQATRIDKLLSLAQALPAAQQGLHGAFGWVSAQWLQGLIRQMLESPSAARRELGIVACTTHRVDPGAVLERALSDTDAGLRARAFQAIGDAGRTDLREVCVDALAKSVDDVADCRFWAAHSAAMLGDRRASLAILEAFALGRGPRRSGALSLLLKLKSLPECGMLLKRLYDDPASLRAMLRGIGMAGDPRFVPWLVDRMQEPKLVRLAGESFAMITGCDLASVEFILEPGEGEAPAALGVADDDDAAIALDEDESLPLPDPAKVASWWQSNSQRFAPGTRYFVGAVPSAEHCRLVLRNGYQRQRIAAAEYLSLLVPGTPLFNTAAPAWRQQRWLDAMGKA